MTRCLPRLLRWCLERARCARDGRLVHTAGLRPAAARTAARCHCMSKGRQEGGMHVRSRSGLYRARECTQAANASEDRAQLCRAGEQQQHLRVRPVPGPWHAMRQPVRSERRWGYACILGCGEGKRCSMIQWTSAEAWRNGAQAYNLRGAARRGAAEAQSMHIMIPVVQEDRTL